MNKKLVGAILAGVLAYYGYQYVCPPGCPSNAPVPANPVTPEPAPKPRPKPRPGPWGPNPCPKGQEASRAEAEPGRPVEGGRVSPDGKEEIQVDLPESQRKRNIASKGLGCCVFRSAEYCGRWQHQFELYDLPEKMVKAGIEGGGWPEKVDQIMSQLAPHVAYAQSTARDWELVKAVLASGRMIGVDYNGHDCHYSGQIAHMVCLAHATDRWVAVSDNNFTRADQFVWMSPAEFQRRWGGWALWLLAPPPPPMPHQAQAGLDCPCGPACPCSPCPCGRDSIGGPVFEWKPVTGDPTQVALFLGAEQVGNYSYTWQVYRPLANGVWGEPTEPPVLPPGVEPPTGVDEAKVRSYGRDYAVNGKAVSRDSLLRAVTEGKAPDDQAKPYLTLVGVKEKTDPVLAALAADPRLKDLAARFKINTFAPQEWQVAEGFARGGDVTVYLQYPDGRVLSRTDSYPGSEGLARAMNGALRKADPQYQPQKDPDLSKPFQLPDLSKVPPPVWYGGAGAVLYALFRRKEK